MKIYHLEANGKTNTGEYVRNICEALNLTKEECCVFTACDSFHGDREIAVFGNYGKRRGVSKLYSYIIGWIRIFNLLKVDKRKAIFHAHWLRFSPVDYFFLKRIKKLSHINLVFTVHNILPHEPLFFDGVLYKQIYSLYNGLVFHSQQNILDFEKAFSNLRAQKAIIPHYSYKVEPFIPAVEGCVKLLFFGAIRPYKGLELLIEALGGIENNIDWELVIAGKPDYDINPLKSKVKDNIDLSKRITWQTGWIEDAEIPWYFQNTHIVVLPYLSIDNSGLVHLAMSYGKTVIVPKIGVFKDLIEDGINGYYFELNDAVSLQETIRKVIKEAKFQEIGGNAILKMEGHSLDIIGNMLQEVYKNLKKL